MGSPKKFFFLLSGFFLFVFEEWKQLTFLQAIIITPKAVFFLCNTVKKNNIEQSFDKVLQFSFAEKLR